MKLWVDDLRPAPDGWTWAKNSKDAMKLIASRRIDEISLDHDLGGEDTTRGIVNYMAANHIWPSKIYVHTANPVGRDYLIGVVTRYGPGVSYGNPS